MSSVTNTNFLHPSSFKIIVDRQNYANLEWFAQSVDHPSVGLPPAPAQYSRITEVPFPGDKLEFPEVNFNVLLDENMEAYTEVYNWMRRLVETKYTPKTESTASTPPSICDLTLLILNSSNNVQKKIIYRDAFPTNIGNIPMGAEAVPSPILVPFTFQFTYFDIE